VRHEETPPPPLRLTNEKETSRPVRSGLSTLVTNWTIQIDEMVFRFQNQSVGKTLDGCHLHTLLGNHGTVT